MKTIYFALFLLFIYGCTESDKNIFHDKDIVGQQIISSSDVVCGFPAAMRVVGDMIYVLDNSISPIITQYTLDNIELVNSYGMRGNGPGELVSPSQMRFTQEGLIELLDSTKGKLVYYDTKGKHIKDSVIFHKHKRPVTFTARVTDSTYIVSNMNSDYQIELFNNKGLKIKSMIDIKDSKEPNYMNQMTYCFDNSSKIVVAGTLMGDVLSIYDFENDKTYQIVGADGVPRSDDGQLSGFLSIKIVKDKIYALYCGLTYLEKERTNNFVSEGQYIQTYTLTGEPLIRYTLDRSISAFDVDIDKGIIWGFDTKDENPICKFIL